MITINVYPSAHDGDTLAMKANVLENYKSHGRRLGRAASPLPAVSGSENRRTRSDAPYLQTVRRAVCTA
jgi:hypothetical protein